MPDDHISHRTESSSSSQASSTAQMRSLRESQRAALLRSQRETLARRPHPYHPSEPVTPTSDTQNSSSLENFYQSLLDQEVARRTGQSGLNKTKGRMQASRRRILDHDEDSGMSSSDEPIRRKIPRKRIPNVIKPIPEVPTTPTTPSSYSTFKETPKTQWSFRASSARSGSPLSFSSIPLSSLASFRSIAPTSLHTIRRPSDLEDRPLAELLRR